MNDAPAHPRAAAPARDPLRALRYAWRVPLLLLHLFVALPLTLLAINPLTARWRPGGERADHRVIRWWSYGLVRIFGMRVAARGEALPGGVLFVANHVSWIDISVLHAMLVMGFVAKSEISRWPLVGWLARRADTIYHRRGSNESLSGVLHQMVQRLREGKAVGVFPEGGTGNGEAVRTFHARIFEAAVVAECPVQPVALRYGADGAAQKVVAFRPGEHFLGNFLRLLGEPARPVEVHFLAPLLHGSEQGRRRMAETCRNRIVEAMGP
jgi:1-acyl-sn-glycerol-3-phosphate acyltransferase